MEEYSRTPPRTAPRRFDPSAAAGSLDRFNKDEKIRPANAIGSEYSNPPTIPRSNKGSRFRIPAPVIQVVTRQRTSGR
jgi:hypothetical protein